MRLYVTRWNSSLNPEPCFLNTRNTATLCNHTLDVAVDHAHEVVGAHDAGVGIGFNAILEQE